DLRRQLRAGRGFRPVNALQIVAYKLFVERGLRPAGFILRGGPESRRIRRERLVDPNKLVLAQAKLKFCVRQQNPSRLRVRGRAAVDFQADLAHLLCTLSSNQRSSPLE